MHEFPPKSTINHKPLAGLERLKGLKTLGRLITTSVVALMPTQDHSELSGKMTYIWSRTAFYST